MSGKATSNSIDVAKLAAALLVVAIHVRPLTGLANVLAVQWLARMAVPFFVLVSAYFFFGQPASWRRIAHYERRMAWLYGLWFVAQLPIVVERSFLNHPGGFWADLAVLSRNLVLGSTFRGSWFVMALMIDVPLVWWLSRRWGNAVALALGMALWLPLCLMSRYGLWQPHYRQLMHLAGYPHLSFVAALPCVALGKIMREHAGALLRRPGLACTALAALLAASLAEVLLGPRPWFDDLYLLVIPAAAAWVWWLLTHELPARRPLVALRNASTITFFSHFIFLWALQKMHWGLSRPVQYVVIVAACLLLTVVLRRLARVPGLQWLQRAF